MAQPCSYAELTLLADDLYNRCNDDDAELARLMHELDPDTAVQLCTSDLTNAAQAYMYAFNEIPDDDVYDILLLEPSSQLLHGIKIILQSLLCIATATACCQEHQSKN